MSLPMEARYLNDAIRTLIAQGFRESAVQLDELLADDALIAEHVSRAYEAKVTASLERRLPAHTDGCDHGWTSGRCLRCDVLADIQETFGLARPLNVARVNVARAASTAAQVWLEIGPHVHIALPREEALKLDRAGFARVYRDTVAGSSKKEAFAWADQQITDRDGVLGRG